MSFLSKNHSLRWYSYKFALKLETESIRRCTDYKLWLHGILNVALRPAAVLFPFSLVRVGRNHRIPQLASTIQGNPKFQFTWLFIRCRREYFYSPAYSLNNIRRSLKVYIRRNKMYTPVRVQGPCYFILIFNPWNPRKGNKEISPFAFQIYLLRRMFNYFNENIQPVYIPVFLPSA